MLFTFVQYPDHNLDHRERVTVRLQELRRLLIDPNGEREVIYLLQEEILAELQDVRTSLMEQNSASTHLDQILTSISNFLSRNGFE